jgi:GNAT superfamily N-acetyltransferase
VPAGVTLGDVDGRGVAERIAAGHEPFALWIDGQVAAYGWSTAGPVHMGEITLDFVVPPDERYLWDFATLPPFRGRGLYPRLLQAIIRHQTPLAEWFWIGHEPHNLASQRGIAKAGFVRAGDVWCHADGHFVLAPNPSAPPGMVRRAQRTLGLPLVIAEA